MFHGNSQSPHECGRQEGIAGKLPGKRRRHFPEANRIGRERVIAQDGATGIDHHKGRGDFAFGILAGLMMEVLVQFGNAAVKVCTVVGGPESFDSHFLPIVTPY